MKKTKILSISLALMLAISYLSTSIYAENVISNETIENEMVNEPLPEESKYNGSVSFMNQWTNESSETVDTIKKFSNPNDKLGNPASNSGLFRGVAKTFLGWSDKEPIVKDGNFQLADGARLFSTEDTIENVFPSGIPQDAKLYGFYFSLNAPKSPLGNNKYSMGVALLSGIKKIKINNNEININNNMEGSDILPNTKTIELKKENKGDLVVIDEYSPKDDAENINELVLKSEFRMDDITAMLVYKNPNIGYVGNVLTSNYNNNKSDQGDFSTNSGDIGYTYMDLKIEIDHRITVPENLYLEFKGYSWRPLYVFGEDKTPLNILNPSNDTNLGNTKNSFNTLISNSDPIVRFGVETKGNHNLTIRTIIRHDDLNGIKEKIEEKSIVPEENSTIAEKILENMTLRAITSKELEKISPVKSKTEINKNVVRISDSLAKSLAETNGETKLTVKGIVNGMAIAYGGKVSVLTLRSASNINDVESNILSIGYKNKSVSQGGSGGSGSHKPKPDTKPSNDRIDGKDRVETSVNVSKDLYPNKTRAVILANKDKFSDVLTAVPFSVQMDAPILYTNAEDLPEVTENEIQRLNPSNVYINGGTSSVSKEIERNLLKKGYSLHRFNGTDRYDTARLIAEKIRNGGNKNTVEIASGEVFPDALSMSMFAVKHNAPILLSKKEDLTDITKRALDVWDIENIYIAGGNNTISKNIENELKLGFKLDPNKKLTGNESFGKYDGKFDGAKNLARYGGKDRYETSAIIAKASVPNSELAIATSGEVFADALIAGPYAGKHKAPVLLMYKNSVPKSIDEYTKSSKIKKFKAIGGIDTLSEYVLTYLSKIKN